MPSLFKLLSGSGLLFRLLSVPGLLSGSLSIRGVCLYFSSLPQPLFCLGPAILMFPGSRLLTVGLFEIRRAFLLHTRHIFLQRFFPVKRRSLPGTAYQKDHHRRQNQQPDPAISQGDGKVLQEISEMGQAVGEGPAQTLHKARRRRFHRGQPDDLIKTDCHRGEVYKGVIVPQFAGKLFDCKLRLGRSEERRVGKECRL